MNTKHLAIAGPYTHENLSIFLLLGADALDGQRFIPLDDALEQKCVTVHETGDVGQLEVENLSEHFDLYIQAGDVVKGGRQDRTLGVDFVLPAKSGRVPIPSFCVESGRWHRRAAEEAGSFSSSKSYLSSKKLRMAAKMSKSQGEVWDHVAETQQHLSKSLGKSLHAAASPMRSARWMPFPTSSPWLAGSTTSAFSAVRSPGWRAPASRMITGAKPVRSSASTEPITTHTPRSMDCDIPTPCTS